MNYKILHYALGPSPYRSGGMTVYVESLIQAQCEKGNKVGFLYPSGISLINYPNIIIKHYFKENIDYFEIKNPLPVSILDGIKKPSIFYTSPPNGIKVFTRFLKTFKPDIIHIHTLMGLPKCFLEIAKTLKIKVVYTTHDYFGLCPKTNFINNQNIFCGKASVTNCTKCNQNAPGHFYIRLRNEPLIHKYKKYIPHIKLSNKKNNILQDGNKYLIIYNDEYAKLLDYYKSMFMLFDKIHFNSTITEKIYNNILVHSDTITIPITHNKIKDNRIIKKFDKCNLKIGFIGNLTAYKGFPNLKTVLLELYKSRTDWSLKVWGNDNEGYDDECSNIIYKGRYKNKDINQIFNEIDLLIVPSICKETFSLVALEALSFGVPVIVSNNVGAKDIIKQYNNKFIYKNKDELKSLILSILDDRISLISFNYSIIKEKWNYSMDSHVHNINNLLYQ